MTLNLSKVLVVLAIASLTACSNGMWTRGNTVVIADEAYRPDMKPSASREPVLTSANEQSLQSNVGENIQMAMDSNDQTKLSRALDSSPGKSTQWVNESTGVTYTVVPIKKVIVSGNPFCREYNVTAERRGKTKQTHGTACVGSDGTWKVVHV